MKEILNFLLSRRSVMAINLAEPAPNAKEREEILTAAARVPDHGKLAPWRFVMIEGAREKTGLGIIAAERFAEIEPRANPDQLAFERNRFLRTPLIIMVISSPKAGKIDHWEQVLSAGAVCQNMLIATHALGFSAQWLTEWVAYDEEMKKHFGLEEHERIAGFIHIGTAKQKPTERERPLLENILSKYKLPR
ncbi:MAG: nitroreductase family protein [Parvibaculales bacterium]